MDSLALALFGGFKLTLGGSLITDFESSKVQALLAYLVVEADHPHHRTALATLLWPDHPEAAARTNLRHVLRQLRQVLGDRGSEPAPDDAGDAEASGAETSGVHFLIATRNTIHFNTQSQYTLDVTTFSTLLGREAGNLASSTSPVEPERIAQLHEAAQLYRGDFLAGFYVQDGELFDAWASQQREFYHRQALDLFFFLANHYSAAGNWSMAQHYAMRQVELEPWREEAHRQLMLILARSNQRSAALAQFEQCRVQLEKELGVEPSAETVELYEQIRSGNITPEPVNTPSGGWEPQEGASASSAPAPVHLPHYDAPSSPTASSFAASPMPTPRRSPVQEWGEAPLVTDFYGRDDDQATLRRWLLEQASHLIVLLGMGGMGKTTLVAHTAKAVAGEFEFVFWRSLLNAPPLATFLRESLRFFSRQQLSSLPDSIHEQLNLLFDYLRNHRCLLVLDNLESILDAETSVRYRPGYEGYGYLIERVGQSEHQSCLILTSRELPQGIMRMEDNGWVNILQLGGLEDAAGQALLETRGLAGKAQAGVTLVRRYSGNPLALKLVARTIQEFFDGDIAAFLSDELPIFDDIRAVLEQQFARLTPLERELLIWMAIERDPVSLGQLTQNLVRTPSRSESVEALRALQRRSLLEKSETGFVLQNVVIEFATEYLVNHVSEEFEQGELTLFSRYALLKAQAMEYVRQSQMRLILAPVARRLVASLGQEQLQVRLRALPDILRASPTLSAGYAGGNLLNLMLHLGFDCRGMNFSRLTIRQANLRGVHLPEVDFSSASFSNSYFTDTFNVVRAVACSPDDHLLVAGTSDGEIRVWRMSDGQALAHNQGHARPVNGVVFRASGDLFASAGNDFTVRLWEAESGRSLRILNGHTGWVNAIAFSPNGQWLASASSDQSVRLWNVASGDVHQIFEVGDGAVRAVAFHPNGRVLATASSNVIRLWDPINNQLLAELPKHTAIVTTLLYSPDGRFLASGSADCTVRLWRAESGESVATLLGHGGEVRCLAFSPEGETLASGSADYTVRLWDLATIDAASEGHRDLSFSPIRYTLHGHVKGVNSLAFTPQGETLISGGDDHTIHFWNPRNGSARDVWFGHTGWVRNALFSPDGSTVASCGDDTYVRLWNPQSGEMRHLLKGHRHWVWSLAFSPDGSLLASGGADHLLCIWNAETGQLLHTLRQHDDTVRALAFSPNGTWLASGSADCVVHLWEPRSGRLAHTLRGHTGWIQTLAFHPDGTLLATAGNDQIIRLWRIGHEWRADDTPQQLHAHQGTIISVVFSPDGKRLASAGDAPTLCLWNVETGELERRLDGHENGVNSVVFSPDGCLLASGASDHTVRLWEVSSGKLRAELRGHDAWVRSVAFSPDGRFLASGSADHTVRIWDVETGQLLHVLRGHSHWVWSLHFCPRRGENNETLLASSSVDETVRVWDAARGLVHSVLKPRGPYAGMNITGVTGISEAQKTTLKQLGAFEA